MKRAEILKRLEGVDGADEIVDFIMSENGKDIEKAKVDTSSYEQKISELQNSLKQFEKGGEKYFDVEELNRLKQFETETKQKQTFAEKNSAIINWLKENNASPKALNLLAKAVDYNSVEIENGQIKNAEKVFETLKTDYKDFFVETKEGGVVPSNPPATQTSGEAEPRNLSEAIAAKFKKD